MLKKIYQSLFILVAFFTAHTAYAQIGLDLASANKSYIQYEPIHLRLTFVNEAGYALPFTDTGSILTRYTLEVEDHAGHLLAIQKDREFPFSSFVLKENSQHEETFLLSRYVDLRTPGSYRVKMTIDHPFMTAKYESNWLPISVVKGKRVWTRTLGTGAPSVYTNSKIPTRDVSLLSMPDGRRRIYYFSIEDRYQIYALYRLGPEFDPARKPICEAGLENNIHILMNVSQRLYAYHVFSINGEQKLREIFVATGNMTPPYLIREQYTRDIKRIGGRLARKDEYFDYGNEIVASPILNTRDY